jgi:hypothetical protein
MVQGFRYLTIGCPSVGMLQSTEQELGRCCRRESCSRRCGFRVLRFERCRVFLDSGFRSLKGLTPP